MISSDQTPLDIEEATDSPSILPAPLQQNSSHPPLNLQPILPSQIDDIAHFDEELTLLVTKELKEAVFLLQIIVQKQESQLEPDHCIHDMIQKFIKLINATKTLQVHFELLLELIEAPSESDMPAIIAKYEILTPFYHLVKRKTDICLLSIQEILQKAVFPLLTSKELVCNGITSPTKLEASETAINELEVDRVQVATFKLETILEYFPCAATMDPNDIFAHKKTSEIWKELYDSAEIIVLGDKETLKIRMKMMNMLFTFGNAMIHKSEQFSNNSLKDKALTAVSGVYYGANWKEAQVKSSLYLTNPKLDSAFTLWHLPDNEWVRRMMKLALPKLGCDKKVYLQRLFPPISREAILNECKDGTLNTLESDSFTPIDLTASREQVFKSLFTPRSTAIQVRIMSANPLALKGKDLKTTEKIGLEALNYARKLFEKSPSKIAAGTEGVIIHIHGGGFVSGSSASHRTYLYRWAKRLNKTVFSIDYRLAPDNPYPDALDDVWQAYNWIINYAESLLDIKTDKVVVVGDSAGGNLAIALTLRAIKMGIRVPDGCLMAYPALSMDPKAFVPSYFLALEDAVLPYGILRLCIQAYVTKEFSPDIDPYLSPVLADEELLKRLPPVRIVTGSGDPLHDISWKFLYRMRMLKKDIKMVVYENMPHGFLVFDQVADYEKVIEGTSKLLEELLADKKEEEINRMEAE